MHYAYKDNKPFRSIGFLFGCDSSQCFVLASNKENLTASVKSTQDMMFTCRDTHSGTDLQLVLLCTDFNAILKPQED